MIFTDRLGQELHAGDHILISHTGRTLIEGEVDALIPLIPHRNADYARRGWLMREDQARKGNPTCFQRSRPSERGDDKLYVMRYVYTSKTWDGKDKAQTKKTAPDVSCFVKIDALLEALHA